MSRDPTRLADLRDARTPESAFMGAVIRAQRGGRTPNDKMQELAGRLGPILQEGASPVRSMPWLGISLAALAAVAGAVSILRVEEPEAPASVSEPSPAAQSIAPASAPEPAALPTVPVEALPSVTVRQPVPTAAPRCDEVELVDRADTKLRSGDPAGALAAVREHEQRCSAGGLVQERERIAVEALAKLGRTEAARTRARAFEDRFPSSPHRRRVRQVLAESEGARR